MKAAELEDETLLDEGVEQVDEIAEPEADAPAEKPEAKAEAPATVDIAEFKRLQKELKEARKARHESDETARYWAERSRDDAPAPKVEAEPDAGEIDIVNELTANGTKGLESVLAKLGYAKKADIESRISATRSEITDQATLLRKYPDLEDDSSPFFKATAAVYNSLKTDPHMAKSSRLIEIAARTAKAEMPQTRRRAAEPEDDDGADPRYDNEDEEDSHVSRVARQSGDRGRRETRSAPEELTTLQKKMVAKFAAVGANITEESYAKRAQSGIRMGGHPPVQRRKAA